MGRKLLTATTFGCGLAVYLAAQFGYIPAKAALPFLIVWVIVLRKVPAAAIRLACSGPSL